MSTLFVLRNQHHLFLDKQGEWGPGSPAKLLFQTMHKDEAINQMVEMSIKHPDLRISIESIEKAEESPKPTENPSHLDKEKELNVVENAAI